MSKKISVFNFLYLLLAVITSGARMTLAEQCDDSNEKRIIKVMLNADGKLPYDTATSGFAIITFYNAVLGRLVHLTTNLTTEPGLLEEAYWDFKNEQYILRIKKDLTFHNGRLVTSEDLEFSLLRFFLTKNRADQVAFLKNIKGVEKLHSGQKYVPWSTLGIHKVDARTISVKLSQQNPVFLYSLADGWISLVPKEELKDDFITWKGKPIGAGAFKVTKIGDDFVRVCNLSQNAENVPHVVDFVSVDKQDADIVGFTSLDLKDRLTKIYGTGPIGFTGLFFNSNNDLASDYNFRKALSLVFKREEFRTLNSDYSPLNEMLTTNFFGRLGIAETYDLSEAKKYLELVPKRLLVKPITAHWFTGRPNLTSTDRRVLEIIEKQLKLLDLSIRWSYSNNPTFASSDIGTTFRVDDRGTAFPDPLAIFRSYEAPAFLSPFLPKRLDQFKFLLDKTATSKSLDVKAEAIHELSKYFFDNTVVVPLYERKIVYWINSNKILDLGAQNGITFYLDRIKIK